MTSFTAIILSAIGLIALAIAAPTTYNERQDGELNVAAKLENIMIVIALPPKTITSNVVNSELVGYLTMLAAANAAQNSLPPYEVNNADSNEPGKGDELNNESHEAADTDADDILDLFSDDDDLKGVKHQPHKSSEKVKTEGESAAATSVRPKARNLRGQIEDVIGNKEGTSLKKELSWDRDEDAVLPERGLDEHSRSNDHNEVGLNPNRHLTLVGGNDEDCGPDRQRNSYGICQALPAE